MRITQGTIYNSYTKDIQRQQENMFTIQQQVTSNKKVNAPSDDPINAGRILSTRDLFSSFEQYTRNIDAGISYLGSAEETLSGTVDVIHRLQELAVAGADDSISSSERSNLGKYAGELYDELVSMANARFDGKYIFSGFKTDTPLYDSSTATYQGDANKQSIQIGAESFLTLGINGLEVFQGSSGGVDILASVAAMKTALDNNDRAGVAASIDSMKSALEQVTDTVAEIGGKANRLIAVKDELENYMTETRAKLSRLEDVDMAKVYSDLQFNQVVLEASYNAARKIFSLNIFDYL